MAGEKLKCVCCGYEWIFTGGIYDKIPEKPICQTCQTVSIRWKAEKVKHFNVYEKWGDPYAMDIKLIWLLDRLRRELGKAFIIHCGYGKEGHVKGGSHGKGDAVDFHIEGVSTNKELWTAYLKIDRFWSFGGVGIYPYWNRPGFHVDIGKRRRWERNENGVYLPAPNGDNCKYCHPATGNCFAGLAGGEYCSLASGELMSTECDYSDGNE